MVYARRMSARLASQEQSSKFTLCGVFMRVCVLFNYSRFLPPTVDFVLVYLSEEDCVSVVPTRNVVDPCPPVIEETCTVQTAKKTYTGIAVAMGTL